VPEVHARGGEWLCQSIVEQVCERTWKERGQAKEQRKGEAQEKALTLLRTSDFAAILLSSFVPLHVLLMRVLVCFVPIIWLVCKDTGQA